MSLFDNPTWFLLADGWGELIGILALFAFYVVGAIIKKFSVSEKEEESETSYSVELAKKRAKERQDAQQARLQQARQKAGQQNKAHSGWDHRQEAKRQKQEQLRQRAKQPPVAARSHPAPQPQKPVRQHPDFMGIQQKTQDFLARQAERIQAAMVPPQTPPSPQSPPMFKGPPKTPKQTIKKTKHTKVEPVKMQPISQTPLDILLRHPSELRSAIILKEILDKPVALRDEWNFDSYV